MATITVVIASYRYGHLISQAIESILSQTKRPDKILVVDDGIGDVKVHADRYGIECIERERNLGTVENFQDILMNRVESDRVLFLGADNWLRQDALELMSRQNADIVSSDIAITGELGDIFAQRNNIIEVMSGYKIWRFIEKDINKGNYIHGSSLYNVDLAKKVGGYEANPNGINTEEDWMLWKKMLQEGASHIHIKEPLLYYRRHQMNFIK